jgi:hypothetical protein
MMRLTAGAIVSSGPMLEIDARRPPWLERSR